ncbi:MAG: LysR substrate-binding domain-containing protein [Methyloceanibacter sp.]
MGTIRQIVCASPAYLARRGASQLPQELAGHDCISFTALSPPELWELCRAGAPAAAEVAATPDRQYGGAAIDAAKAGLGIARVLSYQAEAGFADGSLRLLAPDPQGLRAGSRSRQPGP